MKIKLNCLNCKKPIEKDDWNVKANKTKRFYCNRLCRTTYEKGDKSLSFGYHHSEETKKMFSLKTKKRWSNPKERQKMSQNRFYDDPNYTSDKHPRFGTKYPVSWAKGLTKYTDERVKNLGDIVSQLKKGKTYEEIYGKEKMQLVKQKISKTLEKSKEQRSIIFKKLWANPKYVEKMLINHKSFNTKPEIKMNDILKNLNIKFKHGFYVKIKHRYIADFYLYDYNCIIEVDGNYWHGNTKYFPNLTEKQIEQKELDKIRTTEITNANYKILRFWEKDFDLTKVSDAINNVTKVMQQ